MFSNRKLLPVIKNVVALALGVLLVAAIEGALALVGVRPLADEDPFVGFQGSRPLFREAPGRPGVYELDPAKGAFFNEQNFSVPKPKGTFRMFAFGGSTTYGHPYLARTAFPAWLAQLLQLGDPSRSYEAINVGGISYASYRVRRLVEEMAAYEPDLLVVYSGQNEFLEKRNFDKIIHERPALRALRAGLHRSRIYTAAWNLSRGTRKLEAGKTLLGDDLSVTLEEVGGPNLYHRDDLFRRGVTEEFRINIRAIARFARGRGIPLVLCTVSSNLSGVSPFKTEHSAGLDPGQRARADRMLAEAEQAFRAGDLERALSLLDAAVAIDDRVAMVHFARGQTLAALGRNAEARAAFVRAKEEDIVPLRALEEFNGIIREIARDERVPLADIDRLFTSISPEGIPGPPLFVDHVHPDVEGHQLIATAVLDAAVAAGVVPLSASRWAGLRESARARLEAERAALPPRYLAMGQWVVGRTFFWAAKYPEALGPLETAWATVRDSAEIPYMIGDIALSSGDVGKAGEYLEAARKLDASDPRIAVDLAKVLVARGDGQGALAVLQGIDPGKQAPWYYQVRGEASLLTGDHRRALEDLEQAVEIGGMEQFLAALARGQLIAGTEELARQTYGRILAGRGESWDEDSWDAFRASARAGRR